MSNLSSQPLADVLFTNKATTPNEQTASVYAQLHSWLVEVKPCVVILSSSVKHEQPHLPEKRQAYNVQDMFQPIPDYSPVPRPSCVCRLLLPKFPTAIEKRAKAWGRG